MPDSSNELDAFIIFVNGKIEIERFHGWVTPAVYLTTTTTITSGDGTINNPYTLS